MQENKADEREEAVSFTEVVRRIWVRRGIVGGLVLLAAIGAAAWAAFELTGTSGEVVYHVDLKGVEKGLYPGGAAFSPNDLQSPEVLRAALEAEDIDLQRAGQIADGLRIERGSPEVVGIVKKYRQLLAVRNLSSSEIDSRNEEFKEELESATSSSLRLSVDLSVSKLDAGAARRLLREIPAQWSRIYSVRYRIFEVAELDSAAVLRQVGPLAEPGNTIAAIGAVEALNYGLSAMSSDNRMSYLKNTSGHSASELLERLEVFNLTRFRPLSRAVLASSDPVSDSYRQDLRLQIQYLEAQISSYNQMAEQLLSGGEATGAELAETSDSAEINQLQMSGDALGLIISLTERASSAEFAREVLVDRHELTSARALTEMKLARAADEGSFVPSAAFIDAAEKELTILVTEYQDLYDIAIEVLRADLGTLYSVASAPVREQDTALRTVAVRVLGIVLTALFLGLVIAFVLPSLGAEGAAG